MFAYYMVFSVWMFRLIMHSLHVWTTYRVRWHFGGGLVIVSESAFVKIKTAKVYRQLVWDRGTLLAYLWKLKLRIFCRASNFTILWNKIPARISTYMILVVCHVQCRNQSRSTTSNCCGPKETKKGRRLVCWLLYSSGHKKVPVAFPCRFRSTRVPCIMTSRTYPYRSSNLTRNYTS